MPSEDIYRQKLGISSRKLGSDLMLYDPDNDKVHVLNETGTILWELLDGTNTTIQIENKLKEKFNDIPKETLSKDLSEIIEKLKTEGLISKGGGDEKL